MRHFWNPGYNIESCVCNCKISIDFYALNSIECQNFFEVFCKRSKIQKKKEFNQTRQTLECSKLFAVKPNSKYPAEALRSK